MKNTFWKRERIEIMIALALFNYVFLGAEYLFDNMMAFQTDSSGVVLAQSYVLGISTMGFLLLGVFDEKLRDIAKAMGLNVSTVKTRLSRGKRKLREILSDAEEKQ